LYPDIDGADPLCHHLMGWREIDGQRTLVAYLRCVPPGVKFDEMSLGRVLTTQAGRGTGVGRELLAKAIPWLKNCIRAGIPHRRASASGKILRQLRLPDRDRSLRRRRHHARRYGAR
jgi:predicted GNAT family N-acyltransferase